VFSSEVFEQEVVHGFEKIFSVGADFDAGMSDSCGGRSESSVERGGEKHECSDRNGGFFAAERFRR
jgi:hypothetical protein